MTKKCPSCGEPAIQDASNPHRPFCSKRCQMLDLGAWLTGAYAIEGEAVRPDVDSERGEGHGEG